MDPEYVVFDVSSDEDVGWGEKLSVNDGGIGGDGDDCDWIQQLLNEVDRETEESNDSDDVVLVSEVVANPKLKLKNSDVAVKALDDDDDDDDDDDCVVLDGDPDKLEAVQSNAAVDESDDLQVVGETGQVACRDYPHPRHLCVKYPFTSTPHEKHCNQCHCYVCDSLAPCLLWHVNHCHATDKEELWKNERKSLKIGHQATIPALKAPTLSAEVLQINQDPVQIPFQPTYISQNQVMRPAAIRPCSRASSCGILETDGSGHSVSTNRFRPNLVLQHLRSTGNEAIRSDRRHVSSAGLQVKSPPSVFKRTGPGVPLMPNRRYCLSNQKYGSQCMRLAQPASTPVANNSMKWRTIPPQMGSELNTFQLPSQSNIHANFPNPLHHQPQPSAAPNFMNNLLNSVPQPIVSLHSNTGNILASSVTSQPQLSPQPGSMVLTSTPSQPQGPSQPVYVSSYANTVPFESQVYGQPNSAPNNYQSVQHMNQDHTLLDSSLADVDLSWLNPANGSSQQPTSQRQDTGLVNENDSLPLTEMDNLFSESTNLDALNFQYDSWTLGNSDNPVHSPEPDLSDSSFFFGL